MNGKAFALAGGGVAAHALAVTCMGRSARGRSHGELGWYGRLDRTSNHRHERRPGRRRRLDVLDER